MVSGHLTQYVRIFFSVEVGSDTAGFREPSWDEILRGCHEAVPSRMFFWGSRRASLDREGVGTDSEPDLVFEVDVD